MSSQKEVRYVVLRLEDPEDLESARDPIGWHRYLDLAKKHADREGAGTCVDAEGGSYRFDGPYRRRGRWYPEWTNRNLYQGRAKKQVRSRGLCRNLRLAEERGPLHLGMRRGDTSAPLGCPLGRSAQPRFRDRGLLHGHVCRPQGLVDLGEEHPVTPGGQVGD